jgi:hypothetical protein
MVFYLRALPTSRLLTKRGQPGGDIIVCSANLAVPKLLCQSFWPSQLATITADSAEVPKVSGPA